MTLLMEAIVGETEMFPWPFIVATSDTRSVFHEFYEDTLEFGDKFIDKRDDSYDKVTRVSNNVMMIVGGLSDVTDPIKEFVLKRTKENCHVDDIESILKESLEYLRAKDDDTINHFLDEEIPSFTVRFVGFFKNGDAGCLALMPEGDVLIEKTKRDHHGSLMFAPSTDITMKKDELLDFANSPLIDKASNYVDIFRNHLIHVHTLIASQEVETVSGTCLVYTMINDNGKILYSEEMLDLSADIKKIQEFSSSMTG